MSTYTHKGGWSIESSKSLPLTYRQKMLYRAGQQIGYLRSTSAAIVELLINNVGEFVSTEEIKELLPRAASQQSGAVYHQIKEIEKFLSEADKKAGRVGESVSRQPRKGVRLNPVGTTVVHADPQ